MSIYHRFPMDFLCACACMQMVLKVYSMIKTMLPLSLYILLESYYKIYILKHTGFMLLASFYIDDNDDVPFYFNHLLFSFVLALLFKHPPSNLPAN